MINDRYVEQVQLLIRVLPFVAQEPVFALKGGTAINLFCRNMPRLSVDIDLTYLPVADRMTSIEDIDGTLDRIATAINERGRLTAQRIAGGGNSETRLLVRDGQAQIKIETSPVARGTVLSPVQMRVSRSVEDSFGFAEALVVSFEDLFAGKLTAALDRQHPRDLFDVRLLYDHEGLTDRLFHVFLVYAASSSRPLHELFNPHLVEIDTAFDREFSGMTAELVTAEEFGTVRKRLIADVQSRLRGNTANFLMSLQAADPDFSLIGHPGAAALPAVKWKVLNLAKLRGSDPEKYEEQTAALEALLR